jgi:hypothetical protein
VKVELTLPSDGVISVELYDLTGKKMFSREIVAGRRGEKESIVLNLVGQASGVNLLNTNTTQHRETKKLFLIR